MSSTFFELHSILSMPMEPKNMSHLSACGDGSKPSSPGERQNHWKMDVIPKKKRDQVLIHAHIIVVPLLSNHIDLHKKLDPHQEKNKGKKADFGIVLNSSRMSCAAGEEMIAPSNRSTTADSSESQSRRQDFRTKWLYHVVSACDELISLEAVWIDQNRLQMPQRIVS